MAAAAAVQPWTPEGVKETILDRLSYLAFQSKYYGEEGVMRLFEVLNVHLLTSTTFAAAWNDPMIGPVSTRGLSKLRGFARVLFDNSGILVDRWTPRDVSLDDIDVIADLAIQIPEVTDWAVRWRVQT